MSWNIYFCRVSTGRDIFGPVGLGVGDSQSSSQCTKHQFVPSIDCVKIADLVHLCFVTTLRSTMENTIEQCCAIKFCTKLDKKAAETHKLLKKVYGKSVRANTRWLKKFKESQEGVDDDLPLWKAVNKPNRWKYDSCAWFVEFWSPNECSVVSWYSEHSENRCASHGYRRIKHAKGVRQNGL